MWNKKQTFAVILCGMTVAAVLCPSRACNPEFPNVVLGKTDAELLTAPVADFRFELSRIAAARELKLKAVRALDEPELGWILHDAATDQTDEIALGELKAALPTEAASSRLLETYKAWRAAMRKDPAAAGPVPAGLPEEFAIYDAGALLYHNKDLAGARTQWEKLLALPEGARHARSVWAAYMMGRSFGDSDPARASQWFAQTRALQAAGFADGVGLAVVSLGWEARAQWQLKNWDAAVELFLEEFHCGDETAPWSLRDIAAEFVSGDEDLLAAGARNPTARQIVTAYLAAQGGPYYAPQPKDLVQKAGRWLKAVASAAPSEGLRGAERLAWVAYQSGDMAAADRWLTLGGKAGEQTPVGQWIRSKLFLRAGQMDKAMEYLAKAAAGFPSNEEWSDASMGWQGDMPWKPSAHAAAELAMLKLGRAQFVDALDLLYRNHFWQDAAYIAERVLTVGELKAYVDRNFPEHDPGKNAYVYDPIADKMALDPKDRDHGIRYLLARRLTRLGRWKEARPYFPGDLLKAFDAYIAGIRDGHDAKKSNADRATAFWAAAQIARQQGMELMGTELYPDEAINGGDFELSRNQGRMALATQPSSYKLAPLSAAERERIALPYDAQPEKRYHYRYIACDCAWEAAQLMPDNTDALARLLTEAGQWIAGRDPKAADRFYKALVTRCPGTALGRQAANLKWFPSLTPQPATAR